MKRLLMVVIGSYQKYFSLTLPPLRCKYHPSCSEYALLAIDKYGTFFGLIKSIWRIIRCNPISKGGIDLP